MSLYFSSRQPLGYMQDMFTAPPKAAKEGPRGSPNRPATNAIVVADLSHGRARVTRPQGSSSESDSPATGRRETGKRTLAAARWSSSTDGRAPPSPYAVQPKRAFWSRLLCAPEVYDPYIEAAPVGPGLNWVTDATADSPSGAEPGSRGFLQSDGAPAQRGVLDAGGEESSATGDVSSAFCDYRCETSSLPTDNGHSSEANSTTNTMAAGHTGTSVASSSAVSSGSDAPSAGSGSGAGSETSSAAPPHVSALLRQCTKHNGFRVFDTRVIAPVTLTRRTVSLNSRPVADLMTGQPFHGSVESPSWTRSPHAQGERGWVERAETLTSANTVEGAAAESSDRTGPEEAAREFARGRAERRWQRAEQQEAAARAVRAERLAVRALLTQHYQQVHHHSVQSATPAGSMGIWSPLGVSTSTPSEAPRSPVALKSPGSSTPITGANQSATAADICPSLSSPTSKSTEGSIFLDDEHVNAQCDMSHVFARKLNHREGQQIEFNTTSQSELTSATRDGESIFMSSTVSPASVAGIADAENTLVEAAVGAGAATITENSLRASEVSESGAALTAAALAATGRAFPQPARYPLGSRLYVERVVLARRSQQVYALMALLAEAHRGAWGHYLRLVQLYYYYVNPILAAASAAAVAPSGEASLPPSLSSLSEAGGTLGEESRTHPSVTAQQLEEALLRSGSGAVRHFHTRLRSSAADFQYLKYVFNLPWRQLMLSVRHHLNLDETGRVHDEVKCPAAPEGKGTVDRSTADAPLPQSALGAVCFAATLLHSMELFGRYSTVQAAARDVEAWLAWYYTTSLDFGTESADVGGVAANSSHPLSCDSAAVAASVVVPMQWSTAQLESTRFGVYWTRRQHKLSIMEVANRDLRSWKASQCVTKHSSAEECETCDADSEMSLVITHPRRDDPASVPIADRLKMEMELLESVKQTSTDNFLVRKDGLEGDRLPPETYRTVDVGCFGFSFRSLFD